MKKKLSFVLAFLMTASIMAGCKKTDETAEGIPDVVTTPAVSLTQMTAETTTTAEATTTTTAETTETEETTSESETESATLASETTTASETASAASKEWNETEISETLYIKSECYSREKAVVGSQAIKKYPVGTKIEVIAATDTGYYKLADGTFIHSDYVTDNAPAAATTAATTKKTTTATEDDGLIIDDDITTTKKPSASGSSSINVKHPVSYTDRYPYKQLSASEQELYRNIVEAAYSFSDTADLPSGLDSDKVYKVYSILYDNEPQLFWLSRTIPSALGNSVIIRYSYSKEDAEKYQAVIDANRKEVMKSVNGYTGTISKLKVIYEWVIRNNRADTTAGESGSTIVNGMCGYDVIQCQGYAKTVQYLCDYAGIDCMCVPGMNPEGTSHEWNVVYCEDGYYILDATWGDPQQTWGTDRYVKHLFFLADDAMTKNTHLSRATMTRNSGTVIKLFDPPVCTKTSCYYFKVYDKEYDSYDSAKQAILDDIAAAVKEKRTVVEIRVTSHELWEQLLDNKAAVEFQKYAKAQSSKVSKLMRQKSYAEDAYVVQYDIVY